MTKFKISIKHIFILLFMLALSLSYLSNLLPKFKIPVSGVSYSAEKPTITFKSVLDGSFQNQYGAWRGEQFRLRNMYIQIYSQVKFSLFRTSSSKSVVIGKNDYFYETPYLHPVAVSDNETMRYAELIKEIQYKSEKLGKNFIFIISPSKPLVYPEYVPLRYKYDLEAVREIKFNKTLSHEFDRLGVKYFDSTPLLVDKKSAYQTFTKTGTHWSYVGTALVLAEISRKYPGLIDIEMRNVNLVRKSIWPDRDLEDISNLIVRTKGTFYYPELSKSCSKRIDYFLNGTSFILEINRLISETDNSSSIDTIENIVTMDGNKITGYNSRLYSFRNNTKSNRLLTDDNVSYADLIADKDSIILTQIPAFSYEITQNLIKINDALDQLIKLEK